MSYKINPPATTIIPGNMSSTDKAKVDALYTNDESANINVSPAVSKTKIFRFGETFVNLISPMIMEVGKFYVNQSSTSGGGGSLQGYLPLDKYPGATISSLKLNYQLAANAQNVQVPSRLQFSYREENSITTNDIVGITNLVYTTKGTPVSQIFNFSSQTLQSNRLYYVYITGENGTNAVPFDIFYSIEVTMSNITKILT